MKLTVELTAKSMAGGLPKGRKVRELARGKYGDCGEAQRFAKPALRRIEGTKLKMRKRLSAVGLGGDAARGAGKCFRSLPS
jgi:hypothetical protein